MHCDVGWLPEATSCRELGLHAREMDVTVTEAAAELIVIVAVAVFVEFFFAAAVTVTVVWVVTLADGVKRPVEEIVPAVVGAAAYEAAPSEVPSL